MSEWLTALVQFNAPPTRRMLGARKDVYCQLFIEHREQYVNFTASCLEPTPVAMMPPRERKLIVRMNSASNSGQNYDGYFEFPIPAFHHQLRYSRPLRLIPVQRTSDLSSARALLANSISSCANSSLSVRTGGIWLTNRPMSSAS
jgi:hypothetical protein